MKRNKGIKVAINYDIDKNTVNLQPDFMALLLDQHDKLISNLHFIFYNNLKSPDGSVEHLGNIMIGSSDAAQIIAETEKTDTLVKHILFFVSIHDAAKKNQNFSMVNNLRMSFTNLETNTAIAEFVVDKDKYYNSSNLIVLTEFVNIDNDWQLVALGDFYRISPDEFTDILSTDYGYYKFKEEYYKNYQYMGVENSSVRSVIQRERETQYYRALECTPSDSDEAIKKKYRELVKSFHPDIIQSKGLHKDLTEFADKRFREVKEAYEYIRKKKNL